MLSWPGSILGSVAWPLISVLHSVHLCNVTWGCQTIRLRQKSLKIITELISNRGMVCSIQSHAIIWTNNVTLLLWASFFQQIFLLQSKNQWEERNVPFQTAQPETLWEQISRLCRNSWFQGRKIFVFSLSRVINHGVCQMKLNNWQKKKNFNSNKSYLHFCVSSVSLLM